MSNKQLLIEYSLFTPNTTQLRESKLNSRQPFLVSGKIQAADKPNANKRIYDYDTLKKQVSLYEQGPIAEKRALGELDHPECHRPSAQIMTKDGWKYIKDVVVGEKVMTLNTKSGNCEWNEVTRVINQDYRGKMISIKGKNIDTLVTPNHKFIINDRFGNFKEALAQEIVDGTVGTHHTIPLVSKGTSNEDYESVFILPGYSHTKISKEKRLKFESPLTLDTESWFCFLGFYLAEGHCSGEEASGVFISQNEGEKAEEFRKVLRGLSPDLEWKERIRENSKGIVFYCYDKRLWSYLDKLGDKYTKYIPEEIKEAPAYLLEKLFDWFSIGDGTTVIYRGYKRQSVFTVSKRLVEDLNEILVKIGRHGVIKEQVSKKDYIFAGRLIKCDDKSTLYRLWIKRSSNVHLDKRFIEVKEVDYDSTVHCVTVENGNFYCRDNGKPYWSGNSSVINLKNVCHNITRVWWEGKDLYGEFEILNTPSGNILKELFFAGIKVGVSSRAMGSVTPIGEGLVQVGEDLELLCFDFVSTPSTYGAYVSPVGGLNESYQYIAPANTKYNKVNSIISDLICSQSGICCIR